MAYLKETDVETVMIGQLRVHILASNGYFNASKISRFHGKEFHHWYINFSVKNLIQKTCSELGMTETELILVCNKSKNSLRGTYLHPYFLVHFLTWCDIGHTLTVSELVCHQLIGSGNGEEVPILNCKKEVKPLMQGLYLIKLGIVSHLKHRMNIVGPWNETDYVCKFGRSQNVQKRYAQHCKKFGHTIELIHQEALSYDKLAQAELQLRNIFISSSVKLNHPEHTEIIVFPSSMLPFIKGSFRLVVLENSL